MRLLILIASLAYASCEVLNGDITGDLKPPPAARQETSGYATTVGLGASASTGIESVGTAEGGSWVGVEQQQQQLQQAQQQELFQQGIQTVQTSQSGQDDQGLLASYQPSVQIAQTPQYKNSVLGGHGAQYQSAGLTTGANYQSTGQSISSSISGTGHKYTTVSFGNGLVGLGQTVDYSSIGQNQNQNLNNQNYISSQTSGLTSVGQSQSSENFVGTSGSSANGFDGGYTGNGAYDTISVSQNIQTIPIEVPQSYQVTHTRPVHVPVAVPTPVEVPRPVPIEVPQPVPVYVDRPYPVTVEKPVAVPVPKPIYVKVPHPVSVSVEKPYPLVVEKHVPVKVPYKVELPEYHHSYHHNDFHHNHNQNFDLNNFYQPPKEQQLPIYEHNFHQQHSFSKDHFKPVTHYHSHKPHYEHHEVPHYHGSNHHSTSILSGLTGGLSSKLRGGYGSGVFHHHGSSHGTAGGFVGDHKLANGLDAHLGHSYHSSSGNGYSGSGYKFGHGFSGSLSLSSNAGHGSYASGYTGKYLSSDHAKHSYPSFSYEKFPTTFSTGKYSSFSGYHGAGSGVNYKIPETINQQYDSNGGYKY